MRLLIPILLLVSGAAAATAEYDISLNASHERGNVSVAPTISAPPGTKLRYEMVARKQGKSQANSRQAGNVTVGSSGTASLSKLSFSVAPDEQCEIAVKVYEADKLVAAQSSDCAR